MVAFFFQDDEIFQIRATPTKKCYKGKADQITRKLEAQFTINVEAAWLRHKELLNWAFREFLYHHKWDY